MVSSRRGTFMPAFFARGPSHAVIDANAITIIGPGLLGASIGLGLKARGFGGRIVGVSRRRATAERARELGAIDAVADDLSPLRESQLAIVCVPLSAFRQTFASMAKHDHDGLVITDVGSTKQSVQADAEAALPDVARFVGSHPMAGSEQQGPDAAQAELFVGKPCIICRADRVSDAAAQRVESLWTTLGMRLLHMTPAEHDRATAVASHLPHAAAVLLIHVLTTRGGEAGQHAWDVASTGLVDTTRLASSNPPMRADIMQANRQPLLEALDALETSLGQLRGILKSDDALRLTTFLTQAQQARDHWLEQREKTRT